MMRMVKTQINNQKKGLFSPYGHALGAAWARTAGLVAAGWMLQQLQGRQVFHYFALFDLWATNTTTHSFVPQTKSHQYRSFITDKTCSGRWWRLLRENHAARGCIWALGSSWSLPGNVIHPFIFFFLLTRAWVVVAAGFWGVPGLLLTSSSSWGTLTCPLSGWDMQPLQQVLGLSSVIVRFIFNVIKRSTCDIYMAFLLK